MHEFDNAAVFKRNAIRWNFEFKKFRARKFKICLVRESTQNLVTLALISKTTKAFPQKNLNVSL